MFFQAFLKRTQSLTFFTPAWYSIIDTYKGFVMVNYINQYRRISNQIVQLGALPEPSQVAPPPFDKPQNRYTQNQVSYLKDIFLWGSGHDTPAAKSFMENLIRGSLHALDGNRAAAEANLQAAIQGKNFNPPFLHPYMDYLINIYKQIINSGQIPVPVVRPEGEIGDKLQKNITIYPPAPPTPLNQLNIKYTDRDLAWLCQFFKWNSHNTPAAQTFMNHLYNAAHAVLQGNTGYANYQLNRARDNISCCQPPQVADYARTLVLIVQNWVNIGYIPNPVVRPSGEFFPATQSNFTLYKPPQIGSLPAPTITGEGVLTPEIDDYLHKVFVWTQTNNPTRDRQANFAIRLMLEMSRAVLAGDMDKAKKFHDILKNYSLPYWGRFDYCLGPIKKDEALYDYISALYEIANWIYTEKELPHEIRVPRSIYNLDEFFTRLSPAIGAMEETAEGKVAVLYSGQEVDISEADAVLLEDLQKIPEQQYIESRKEEIARVKKEIQEGEFKDKDPEKLAKEALAARKDLSETKKKTDKEVVEAQTNLEKKKNEYKQKQVEYEVKRQKLEKELAVEEQTLTNRLALAPSDSAAPLQRSPTPQSQLGVVFYDPTGWYAPPPRRTVYSHYMSLHGYASISRELEMDPGLKNPAQLDGVLDKVKKELKRGYDRVRKSISRGFKSVRDEAKRSIKRIGKNELAAIGVGVLTLGTGALLLAPIYLTSFGKRITKEVKRFERRSRKELFRFSARVVKVAPFIKFAAPLLGFIPVIGQLLVIFVVAGVASIEIHYAYKMKRLLEKAAKRALNETQVQVAGFEEKLARMEDLIRRLEAKRKEIAELARLEKLRREKIVAELFQTEEERSQKVVRGGVLGAAALLPFVLFKKPGFLSYLYTTSVAGASIYLLRDTREAPEGIKQYQECLTFAPEQLCRQQYIQNALVKSLPKLAEVPAIQREVAQMMDELTRLTNEPF